jgi:hypothetical protein
MKKIYLLILNSLFMSAAVLAKVESTSNKDKTVQNIELAKRATSDVLDGLKSKLTEQMALNLVTSVGYCHDKAITLTKDFSKNHPQVTEIKRTSLKIRNEINKPDDKELKVLKEWEELSKTGKALPEYTSEMISKDEFRYYKPLKVTAMCMSCHGQPTGNVDAAIKSKYPNDKAFGYKEGDFRGLIRVSLKPINLSQPN